MTTGLTVCTPEDDCAQAARLLCDSDCGSLPVVRGAEDMHLEGILTDRDICCRVSAANKHAGETLVSEAMSTEVVSCSADDDVEEAVRLMEECQIRRIPIVDAEGRCVGIIAQADIARASGMHDIAAEVVEAISKPILSAADPASVHAHAA